MRRRMNKIMAAMLIGAMTASLALTGCGGKKSASKDGKKRTNCMGMGCGSDAAGRSS